MYILKVHLYWAKVNARANFYRPQRSCGQGNIFTPVCHSVHRGGVCLSACWDATPPEQTPPPLDYVPSPPDYVSPRTTYPPPPDYVPPWTTYPPRVADSSIRSTSGRYASYWNAFLFSLIFVAAQCILRWILYQKQCRFYVRIRFHSIKRTLIRITQNRSLFTLTTLTARCLQWIWMECGNDQIYS